MLAILAEMRLLPSKNCGKKRGKKFPLFFNTYDFLKAALPLYHNYTQKNKKINTFFVKFFLTNCNKYLIIKRLAFYADMW